MTHRWLVLPLLSALTLAAAACGSRVEPVTTPDLSQGEAADKGPEDNLQGPIFQDVTNAAGVNFSYRNGQEAGHYAILESLGGGLALIDYDNDGLLDIFLPGGGYYVGADKKQIRGHPCKLYRNLGNFKFQDVTRQVGIDGPWFYTHGAAVADYDRDGYPDLLVTGWSRLALYHNEPVEPKDPTKGRRFVEVSQKAGLTLASWSSSAAFADLDGDGYPDLYVCYYADWSFAKNPRCSYDGKTRDVCPPKQFNGLPHKLYRNNRDGTFTDVSQEAGLLPPGPEASKGLGVILFDVNNDGRPDIYVANDTVDNFLYVNHSSPGRFRFEEVGLFSGTARDDKGTANGSMGLAIADYNGNGRPSLFVANYEGELHALYNNQFKASNYPEAASATFAAVTTPCGQGPLLATALIPGFRPERIFFSFMTQASGIAAIGQKYVGWGCGFVDLDHHGWEDLIISNGHAIRHPTNPGITRSQRPVLLRNHKGRFRSIADKGGPYFAADHLGRGLVIGDLDNDGLVDVALSPMNEPTTILRNEVKTDNHWLGVQLVGRNHADVVGAKIVLEANGRQQERFAYGGGSYASSSDRRHVFGLGKATRVDRLTVIWPNREVQVWDNPAIDRYHRLTQGDANATK